MKLEEMKDGGLEAERDALLEALEEIALRIGAARARDCIAEMIKTARAALAAARGSEEASR